MEGPCNDSIGYFINFRQNWYLTNYEEDLKKWKYTVIKNKDNTGKYRKNEYVELGVGGTCYFDFLFMEGNNEVFFLNFV